MLVRVQDRPHPPHSGRSGTWNDGEMLRKSVRTCSLPLAPSACCRGWLAPRLRVDGADTVDIFSIRRRNPPELADPAHWGDRRIGHSAESTCSTAPTIAANGDSPLWSGEERWYRLGWPAQRGENAPVAGADNYLLSGKAQLRTPHPKDPSNELSIPHPWSMVKNRRSRATLSSLRRRPVRRRGRWGGVRARPPRP